MEIGKGYFANVTRWLADLRGRVPLELDERVVPTFTIADVSRQRGVQFPHEGEACAGSVSVQAGAGQTAKIFFTAADETTFIVPKYFEIWKVETTVEVWVHKVFKSVALNTYNPGCLLERPIGQDVGGVLIESEGSAAFAGTPRYRHIIPNASQMSLQLFVPPPMVIRPNEAMVFEGRDVAGMLRVMGWFEIFTLSGTNAG